MHRCDAACSHRLLTPGQVLTDEFDSRWAQCNHCHKWWHWVCAMYNPEAKEGKEQRPFYCQQVRQT